VRPPAALPEPRGSGRRRGLLLVRGGPVTRLWGTVVAVQSAARALTIAVLGEPDLVERRLRPPQPSGLRALADHDQAVAEGEPV
jgi:hypothetical protein